MKKYIDFGSGIGVVSVGHGNKIIAKTIYEQAERITHISNLFAIEPQSLLAKKVVELSGYDMACFFGNSGAEANEAAIKIARKYGQRKYNGKRYKVITLENSFHGRTITTSKATGQVKVHKKDFKDIKNFWLEPNKYFDEVYNNHKDFIEGYIKRDTRFE